MNAAIATHNLRGMFREQVAMAKHTSWRAGGGAQYWYRPADLADLSEFLRRWSTSEAILWIGLGSNLLVRDGGINGVVISTHSALGGIALQDDDKVRVEAGVPCAKVARFCARQQLVGAEFFAGIPGTMGGALYMNAGAWGGETWDRVCQVETIDRQGQLRCRVPAEFDIGYRHSRLRDKAVNEEWFVAAHLQLECGDGEASRDLIRQLLERRNQTQPTGVASCGSVFRNPPGDYAARLIETAGLKGACVGDACVSTKHSNFIVNTGSATATDIESLMQHVIDTVLDCHGVRLQPEVRIVGAGQAGARQIGATQ